MPSTRATRICSHRPTEACALGRLGWAFGAVLALAVTLSCATGPRPVGAGPGRFALYEGRYRTSAGEGGKFRLLLVLVPPDRMRIDIYGPLGRTWLRVEGSRERACVTLLRERRAWVGSPRRQWIARLFGVALGWEEWLAVLRGEAPSPSPALRREPPRGAEFPRRLELTTKEGVEIVLRRRGRVRAAGMEAAGQAEPPPGFEVHPLESWGEEGTVFLVPAGH